MHWRLPELLPLALFDPFTPGRSCALMPNLELPRTTFSLIAALLPGITENLGGDRILGSGQGLMSVTITGPVEARALGIWRWASGITKASPAMTPSRRQQAHVV